MFQSVLVCVDILSAWFFSLSLWEPAKCCKCTANLFKSLKVLSEESHGPVRPRRTQLHDAVFQQLLDVVLLHIVLTLAQAPLLFTAGCHADLSLFKPYDPKGRRERRLRLVRKIQTQQRKEVIKC